LKRPNPVAASRYKRAGLAEFAKYFPHEGHTVDSRYVEERTPLRWASSTSHSGIVSTPLEYGAEPDTEDEWGVKPIHFAATI
jgi:ankyrin repeat protein